jgi:alkyldihydroxyacetonephosphate synthase
MSYRAWGWGDLPPDGATLEAVAAGIEPLLGFAPQPPEDPAPLAPLPPGRLSGRLPSPLRAFASADPVDRARHGLGRSYRDLVRGIRGTVDAAPDLVLRPGDEQDVADILDWATSAGVAVVPFGGGTSVVGGVEPAGLDAWPGVVSLDVGRISGVAEVDPASRAARVLAGTSGPALEDALRPHRQTARFFPQSFERSTVGGWIATRAAGHFSTRLTHIDDLVESVRAVTPSGVWESRRLPGSGAGPSPDRLLLGSEGTLGVITSCWLRTQPRPAVRWSGTYAAKDFAHACEALRLLLHAGLLPATARAVDPDEARVTGTLATGEAALVLGFESVEAPIDEDARTAETLLADAGLRCLESGHRRPGGAGDTWRSTFVQAPYLRESLVLLGVLVETFETAVTWDRLPAFVADVRERTRAAAVAVAGAARVTCRITHVYPDGAAPYFTVFAPARRGSELAQWDEIKASAADAIMAAGGTITHHHAVGRDHRRWYDAQRPGPFAAALGAAKRAVDPAGMLNPGVLLG